MNNNKIFIHTPIDRYKISGRDVFVKREDLCIPSNEAPALAKLRGVYSRLLSVKDKGFKTIGVTDTRISKAGWGVSYLLNKIDGSMNLINFYPVLKNQSQLNEPQKRVIKLGYDIYAIKAGRLSVVYSRANKILAAEYPNSYMLPLGLVVIESVVAIRDEALTVEDQYLGGDVVISVGSGMTILGLSLALSKKVNKIYGISAGMSTDKQIKRIKNIAQIDLPGNVELIKPAGVEYYEFEDIETPFPCSPYYDKKAYRWMVDNIEILKQPILFWNIGV